MRQTKRGGTKMQVKYFETEKEAKEFIKNYMSKRADKVVIEKTYPVVLRDISGKDTGKLTKEEFYIVDENGNRVLG